MDEAQFRHALIVVLLLGAGIMGTGATVLYIAFRTFGGAKAGRPAHFALLASLIAFILLCCMLIYRVS
ncbi:MAG TPA: hypothetical protein VJZ00_02330 [Thermoanaerobaculia bacterium]|nr:hypothetical protein [Thermoanaerobaculia bacterium]